MDCLACHLPNTDGARFCAKCGAPLPVPKTADADPLIGHTVGGRYRVTGVIGEGGMGRVYVGEQQMGTTVRKVAIKTLLAQFAHDPQTVARFMREVGTVSELEHPNTIKVYDFGQVEERGDLYIAMELLQGQALDEVLGTGQPLHPERVDRIIGQVCGSLQEAHDKGIVHRDLKPANIFLIKRAGESDVVKVLDFGIAKRGSSATRTEQKLTQQGTILGTPPYMSPEQFTGRELDARSDLYSLGILTYEMLTGRLPFEADTPWQWMTQHMNATPFPFETTAAGMNAPPKMKQAVMRALSKDPAHRPQSAREFFEDLTLGATRMSVVGLGSGGVGGIPAISGYSAASYSGQYLHSPSGGQQAYAQSYGSSPPPGFAPSHSPSGHPLAPHPGMRSGTFAGEPMPADVSGHYSAPPGPRDSYVSAGHIPVPTAGGQAYPMPPARTQRGGSGAIIGAVVALFVLGGAGGTFFYWRSTHGTTTGDGDDNPVVATTATADGTSTATVATPTPTPTPAPTPKPTAPKSVVTVASAAPPQLPTSVPGHSAMPTDAEWSAQKEVAVTNATKLGCEAKAVREWVRVLCKNKNDSGGSPLGLKIEKDDGKTGDQRDMFSFFDKSSNASTLVFPFQDGTKVEATFSWTDKGATFTSDWAKGAPKPSVYGVFSTSSPTVVANNSNNARPHQPPPGMPTFIPPPPPPPPPPPVEPPPPVRPPRADRPPRFDRPPPIDRPRRPRRPR